MGLYEALGVRPVINGVGPATRLGGLPVSDAVWAAMRESMQVSVRISVLQAAAGRRLAELLGVPACYVTSGAASALTLATAVAITGRDVAKIDALPNTAGMVNRVVVQRAQRDPYDHALTAAGAELVEIGFPHTTHRNELERVLDERTAAVLVRPGAPGNLLSLRTISEIAHAHGVPVIVDGALRVPPIDRLHQFFADGADLVAVSGGKKFRAPQATGILCGRPDLIDAVPLHQQDMDEREETWLSGAQATSDDPWADTSPPRHGIGRSMKVGREQIVGLVTAVDRHINAPGVDDRIGLAELDELHDRLTRAGHTVDRGVEESLDVPTLHIDLSRTGVDLDDVIRALATGDPAVAVGEDLVWRGVLVVNPLALLAGDAERFTVALGAALERAGVAPPTSASAAHQPGASPPTERHPV
ncbi:aminotransferase class V-fold PLP-dependent enzyme [Plantibacter sp. YIM 135249]|uniref:aminotransferase class V-fold PLP-dependent enzyme n=1 Tax=Plantibacter sp. YIM 135249 TaxID=3423918 RepID=UPI003D34FD01